MKVLLLLLCTGAAFAQAPSPADAPAGIDSLRRAGLSPTQYDFYYSAKQATTYEEISLAGYTQEDRIKKNRFRDRTFTEVVPKGLKVLGGFDDYVLIGSGVLAEIRSHGEW